MNLSPQAKEMIQKAALKTGVSEETLLFIYWNGYSDGVLDLCNKLNNGRQTSGPHRAVTDVERDTPAAHQQRAA